VGIKIINGTLESGFLDYGISKSQGFSLDKYIKGGKTIRAPGTVSYMSPRTHIWKPMTWMDDFLASFFTMYSYSTAEGKSSFDKIVGYKRYKSPLSDEDRKTISAESLALYCLKNPPWMRFPYGNNQGMKRKQQEIIVKEEISLAMLKIHSMSQPQTIDDIISIILNIDGYLDDTMDLQGLNQEDARGGYSMKTAQVLHNVLTKQLGKFYVWWLEFSMEVRRLIDQFWETTSEINKEKSYQTIIKLLKNNVPAYEPIEGLIEDSAYGRKLIEANFE
jgi:hypothetical protein